MIRSFTVCLQDGNISAALQYLKHFDELCKESTVRYYCKNPTINAALSFYAGKAEELGICVTINFSAPCLHLSSDIDFSIMLANSFENAVNGCMKLSDTKQLEIRVTCLEENQMLYEIANTCLEEAIVFDENHFPLSQNPGHGIGTRSIIAFAQKNNAALDYQIEDGFFRLRILPPTHAAEASQ